MALYPPTDQGMTVRSAEQILKGNQKLIDRLRLHAATTDEHFDTRCVQPLVRLAAHINVVPATASSIFAGEGGLFRSALEMGFFSFQASDGRIFTGAETVERRHALETKWRYVCFLAGLLYPLGGCLDTIVVMSDKGIVWRKHQMGITNWALSTGAERIFVSWGDADPATVKIGPSAYTSGVIGQIVGADNLQWIEDGSPELVKALYAISAGQETIARNAQDVITSMWEKVQRREEARLPQSYGRMSVGTHLGPYLAGALSGLVEEGRWKPNGTALKIDTTGIYLVWPQAAHDIIDYGRRQSYAGWPANAATIAELLKACQVVEVAPGDDLGMFELIDSDGEIIKAYRVRNPLSVIENYNPEDYSSKPPKRLEAVLAADPLASVEANIQTASPVVPVEPVARGDVIPVEPLAKTPAPTSTGTDATPASQDAVATQADIAASTPGTPPKHGAHALPEAREVRYSDLVPDEVRKDIKRGLSVELLGKVVMAWKSRGDNSRTMRMTDNGAAITLEFLATIVRDTPKWVGEMAEAGLIYSPTATPGLKIHKIAIPEGSKPREAVVLSRYAVKKLEL